MANNKRTQEIPAGTNKQQKIDDMLANSARTNADVNNNANNNTNNNTETADATTNLTDNNPITLDDNDNGTQPSGPDNNAAAMAVDEGDDQTVVQSNQSPPPPPPTPFTYTRCDIKLNIKGDTDDYYMEALKQVQIFFKQVKKYDREAVIVPWIDPKSPTDTVQPAITTPNDIPREEEDAEDYFYGLNPRDHLKGPQDCWFKIKIGHLLELLETQKKMSRFMKKGNGNSLLYVYK